MESKKFFFFVAQLTQVLFDLEVGWNDIYSPWNDHISPRNRILESMIFFCWVWWETEIVYREGYCHETCFEMRNLIWRMVTIDTVLRGFNRYLSATFNSLPWSFFRDLKGEDGLPSIIFSGDMSNFGVYKKHFLWGKGGDQQKLYKITRWNQIYSHDSEVGSNQKTNIAMETPAFEDAFPIEHGTFPCPASFSLFWGRPAAENGCGVTWCSKREASFMMISDIHVVYKPIRNNCQAKLYFSVPNL